MKFILEQIMWTFIIEKIAEVSPPNYVQNSCRSCTFFLKLGELLLRKYILKGIVSRD
jgi:hypothetical protein